jgi:phosphate transport system substrate-binding protein
MWAKGGALAKLGLVAAPDDVLVRCKAAADNLTPLSGAELK